LPTSTGYGPTWYRKIKSNMILKKANYKIGVFVEKNKILLVQGRVVDREKQIEGDL